LEPRARRRIGKRWSRRSANRAQAAGGVYRVGLPRTDITATLEGVELKPGFALGGWLAFEKMGGQAMVIPNAMGSANAINFEPTGGGQAAITGDSN
jgi:hypothetical protein